MQDRDATIGALRAQADGCARLGSPFYATLLEHAARDVERFGPTWALLRADPSSGRELIALRFAGATHRLVLEGRAPAVAAHYPSVGGDGDAEAAWPALRAAVADEAERLAELLVRPVQTNEVGRAAALLAGFLTVAGETGLPLRVLEVGTSAGLNLRWDRFHYRLGARAWGEPGSPVQLAPEITGEPPGLTAPVTVVERRGCDRAPVDATSEDGRLTLLSFTWPDQRERVARLRGALELAAAVPAAVDEADAVDWATARLAEPAPGAATVIFHSLFITYVPDEEQAALLATIERAGAAATAEAPLGWLRMEPGGEQTEVRLTLWPPGEERLIAGAQYHGARVAWPAAPEAAAQERA